MIPVVGTYLGSTWYVSTGPPLCALTREYSNSPRREPGGRAGRASDSQVTRGGVEQRRRGAEHAVLTVTVPVFTVGGGEGLAGNSYRCRQKAL